MWVMRVEEALLRGFCSKHQHESHQLALNLKATATRDGTPGISLAIGDEIIGEWTDSKANSLALTADCQVAVCRQKGKILYLVTVPGEVVSGKQLSDTEVTICAQL
jgi:hypothetical protein